MLIYQFLTSECYRHTTLQVRLDLAPFTFFRSRSARLSDAAYFSMEVTAIEEKEKATLGLSAAGSLGKLRLNLGQVTHLCFARLVSDKR